MRIELDKPLTKTKLRQALKMASGEGKEIKIIMGTEIFDIDTIVSKNGVIYLCTDSESTSDFYAKRVIEDLPNDEDDNIEDHQDSHIKSWSNDYYTLVYDKEWEKKWEEYIKKHGINLIDTHPFYTIQ